MSSGSYLIDQSKYSFLGELGLAKENKGVFNGEWSGNGEVSNICLHGKYAICIDFDLSFNNFVIIYI